MLQNFTSRGFQRNKQSIACSPSILASCVLEEAFASDASPAKGLTQGEPAVRSLLLKLAQG